MEGGNDNDHNEYLLSDILVSYSVKALLQYYGTPQDGVIIQMESGTEVTLANKG